MVFLLSRARFILGIIWLAVAVLAALLLWQAPRVLSAPPMLTPLPTFPPALPTAGPAETAPMPALTATAVSRPTATPLATPTSAPASVPPAAYLNPLTGLPVSDVNLLYRRPIAVKVVHYPRSVRPHQAGLTLADVVYEYYIEDGITRFIAVFYGQQAERVGPVRSGRYFDEHIARMYQAFLVYASADTRVNDYLLHTDLRPRIIIPAPANCPPLCRDKQIAGFNNVFLNTYLVADWAARQGVENTRPDFSPGVFGPAPLVGGQEAGKVYVWYSGYSYHFWEYRPEMGRYLRYSDLVDAVGEQSPRYEIQRDDLTGLPVMADNLVILFVPHGFNNNFDRDDQLYRIDLMDAGRAILFREGKAYEARWQRTAIDQPIRLTDLAYNPLPLKAGNTFFVVLPTESTVVPSASGWYFHAVIPGFGD